MNRNAIGWTALVVIAAVFGTVLIYAATRADSYVTSIGTVQGSPDSPQLEVVWGDCAIGGPLDVEESANQVVLTATVLLPPGSDCPAIGRISQVTLDAPLGTRDVIDASSGSPVRVEPFDSD